MLEKGVIQKGYSRMLLYANRQPLSFYQNLGYEKYILMSIVGSIKTDWNNKLRAYFRLGNFQLRKMEESNILTLLIIGAWYGSVRSKFKIEKNATHSGIAQHGF